MCVINDREDTHLGSLGHGGGPLDSWLWRLIFLLLRHAASLRASATSFLTAQNVAAGLGRQTLQVNTRERLRERGERERGGKGRTTVVWEMVVVLFTLEGVLGLLGASLEAAVCPLVFSSCSPSNRATPSWWQGRGAGGSRAGWYTYLVLLANYMVHLSRVASLPHGTLIPCC